MLTALNIAAHGLDALIDIAASVVFLPELTLTSFAIALGILTHREKFSVMRGVVGVMDPWWLGGLVAILPACGISSNGGC